MDRKAFRINVKGSHINADMEFQSESKLNRFNAAIGKEIRRISEDYYGRDSQSNWLFDPPPNHKIIITHR